MPSLLLRLRRAAIALAVGSPGVLGALGCAEDCDELVLDAEALVKRLGECDGDEPCVVVRSSGSECLGGLLGCGFAVTARRQAEAQREADRLAEASRDCSSCAMASCAPAESAACDADLGRCVVR